MERIKSKIIGWGIKVILSRRHNEPKWNRHYSQSKMERKRIKHQQDHIYNYGIATGHCESEDECIVGVHATNRMYGQR